MMSLRRMGSIVEQKSVDGSLKLGIEIHESLVESSASRIHKSAYIHWEVVSASFNFRGVGLVRLLMHCIQESTTSSRRFAFIGSL